jgi:hypothetical protein
VTEIIGDDRAQGSLGTMAARIASTVSGGGLAWRRMPQTKAAFVVVIRAALESPGNAPALS